MSIYALLDDWLGERFEAPLIGRIAGAPREQLVRLVDFYKEREPTLAPSERRPAELRPFYKDRYDVGLHDRDGVMLRTLLLYSHSVARENHFFRWLRNLVGPDRVFFEKSNPRERIAETLRALASSRELSEAGALTWVEPAWMDPPYKPRVLGSEDGPFTAAVVLLTGHPPEGLRWNDVNYAGLRGSPDHVAPDAIGGPSGYFSHHSMLLLASEDLDDLAAAAARNLADPFFRVPLLRDAFEWHLNLLRTAPEDRPGAHRAPLVAEELESAFDKVVGLRFDGDMLRLQTLIALDLPAGRLPDMHAITRLRAHDEDLYAWRNELRGGLDALETLQAPAETWATSARAMLAESLTPAAERLRGNRRKHSLRGIGVSAVRRFGVASTGFAAGTLAGGNLRIAATTAGATSVADAAAMAFGSLRGQKRDRARLQHYLSFLPEP